jgi:hypothetical protein
MAAPMIKPVPKLGAPRRRGEVHERNYIDELNYTVEGSTNKANIGNGGGR